MDTSFTKESDITFQQLADGCTSDAEVLDALLNDPNVADIDVSVLPISAGVTVGSDGQFQLTGPTSNPKTFSPYQVELAQPSGCATTVTIIGIIDSKIGSLFVLCTAQETVDVPYPELAMTSVFHRAG